MAAINDFMQNLGAGWRVEPERLTMLLRRRQYAQNSQKRFFDANG
jgi:hypothetical protein